MFLGIEINKKRYGFTVAESEKREFSLDNDTETARRGLGILNNTTFSGVNVSGDSAMSLAPVFSSVRVVSEDLASVSCNVVKTEKNGSRGYDKQHPIHKLLQESPNHYQIPLLLFLI